MDERNTEGRVGGPHAASKKIYYNYNRIYTTIPLLYKQKKECRFSVLGWYCGYSTVRLRVSALAEKALLIPVYFTIGFRPPPMPILILIP